MMFFSLTIFKRANMISTISLRRSRPTWKEMVMFSRIAAFSDYIKQTQAGLIKNIMGEATKKKKRSY